MTNVQRVVTASAAAMVVYVCTAVVYRNYLTVLALIAGVGGVFLYAQWLKQGGPRA